MISSLHEERKLKSLRSLLNDSERIVVVTHSAPDGDAAGSSLALMHVLGHLGKEVRVILPDMLPPLLRKLPGAKDATDATRYPDFARKLIADADLIICVDFNEPGRAGSLGPEILKATAPKVMIDHHLHPADFAAVTISRPEMSSTCYLLFRVLCGLELFTMIDKAAAECLLTGMMTDTGNFAFSFLTPELFRAVAVLVEKGISIPDIHNSVYNAYTEGRARLFGYAINRKMEVIQDGTVAYMSLLENEMRRFQFQQGDSEGFVNYALTIKKVKMSAMFLAHRKFIRVSLRSRGDVDVNLFARKYFSGGGHKNAAGGKSFVSMQETIDHYVRSVREFADEGHLG